VMALRRRVVSLSFRISNEQIGNLPYANDFSKCASGPAELGWFEDSMVLFCRSCAWCHQLGVQSRKVSELVFTT
jgi:hypothetical protein